MNGVADEVFGATVRREREKLEIGLRQFAKTVGVSATYLSKVERGELPPPAEDKVRTIARLIGRDADEMLALAGKVSTDLQDIIKQRPREMAAFLRTTQGWTTEEFAKFTKGANKKSKG